MAICSTSQPCEKVGGHAKKSGVVWNTSRKLKMKVYKVSHKRSALQKFQVPRQVLPHKVADKGSADGMKVQNLRFDKEFTPKSKVPLNGHAVFLCSAGPRLNRPFSGPLVMHVARYFP